MGTDGRKNKTGILRGLKAYLNRSKLGELLIIKGFITADQLKLALGEQRENNSPLGQIFIKHSMISRRQLALILARQTTVRACAALMLCLISFSYFTNKKARADVRDLPAGIASISAEFGSVAGYSPLFGSDEKRSGNLSAFTKWTGMFDRFDRAMANPANRQIMQDWLSNVQDFQGLPLDKMAARVNSYVNETKYILDNRNWGQSDYWATPVEFVQKGGDCEDFAIAKYTALRSLGVPEERLRVAIIHDKIKNIPHAVLIVYTDTDALILDNQEKQTLKSSDVSRYRPIFSINRQAWWLHTAPTSSTIVASAD
jgi:predicted transglutaminase-like cysteine proteinase